MEGRLGKLLARQKDLEREIDGLKGKIASRDSSSLIDSAVEVGGIKIIATAVPAPDAKSLRDAGDRLRDKLGSGVICLGNAADGKALLLCMVTKDLVGRYHAGNIIKEIAPLVGGKGGGRPDMAQAGGSKPEGLNEAFRAFKKIIETSEKNT
ncbi:MAG TPA: hypothetical protein ENN79_01145 [Desulfobacteraceae bacterium]|nr:hypothetical protein [Desulfobacteraceae bacterium]